jgi:polysaccharide export outer membrane protein
LVSAKLKIFPAKNQAGGCTELLLANTELLPILLINSVPVSGNVRFPGLYPTSRELNGLDLFNIAGGFLLSKLNVAPTFDIGIRSRGFGTFQFSDLVDLTNITMLTLRINRDSLQEGYIKLVGEFKNPGIYPISKGSTLSEIYDRAGGLTAEAYPLGGIFTRESIQIIEEQGLERSKAELSEILASAAASGFLKQNSTDLVGLIALMTTISNARPAGRLVTELSPAKFKDSPTLDVVLEDGDAIYIPEIQNTITIVGQVLNPVTVPHKVGASFNDYIEYAGGLKKDADKSKIYAVLPNGISKRRQRGLNFPIVFPGIQFQKSDILPGSTIIIPRKARPLDSLTLVETVTPILANLSVTAASIAAISD